MFDLFMLASYLTHFLSTVEVDALFLNFFELLLAFRKKFYKQKLNKYLWNK